MKKPIRNRKKIIKDRWIEYKGETLEICNSEQYGVYEEIIRPCKPDCVNPHIL